MRRRRLLAYQVILVVWACLLFLETKTSKSTAGSTSKTAWTPEVAAKAGDDIILAPGFTITWNTAQPMRSLTTEAGSSLKEGSNVLVVGASTAGPGNVLLHFAASTIVAGIPINIEGTSATAQTITTAGNTLGTVVIKSGLYRLLDGLKTSGLLAPQGGTLEGNGQTIEARGMEATATGSLNLSGCTVIVQGAVGSAWRWTGTGTLTTNAGTIIEIGTGFSETEFVSGGQTYNGTVRVVGRAVAMTGSPTIEVWELLNRGTGATGCRVAVGAVITISSAIRTNGTATERARTESAKSGEAWVLKLPGNLTPVNSFWAIKDCHVEGGTLYLPDGVDLGGNTGIVFGRRLAMLI